MFDVDGFIADCLAAHADGMLAVKDVLDRALSKPGEIAEALPATLAEFTPLYSSADLTILKFVWGPSMSIPPHNHLMWAVNGLYGGQEDNVFYRRTPDGLVESGGRRIAVTESAALGRDVIHAVANPSTRSCAASIHVYGGDFLHQPRSIWDPDERPADGEAVRRLFDDARARATEP